MNSDANLGYIILLIGEAMAFCLIMFFLVKEVVQVIKDNKSDRKRREKG